MTYCLYVKPINHVSQTYLNNLFNQFGEVIDIYIPKIFKTKKRKDFAYIKYNDKYAAANAIESLDQKEINGKILNVKWSNETSKTPEEMVAIKEARILERIEKPKKLTDEEYEIKKKSRLKINGEIFEKYFTAVDYPQGVGEEFTPIYQLNLPPVGERKLFFSWVYISPDRINKILEDHKEKLKRIELRKEKFST